jgi:hypothetical protein
MTRAATLLRSSLPMPAPVRAHTTRLASRCPAIFLIHTGGEPSARASLTKTGAREQPLERIPRLVNLHLPRLVRALTEIRHRLQDVDENELCPLASRQLVRSGERRLKGGKKRPNAGAELRDGD